MALTDSRYIEISRLILQEAYESKLDIDAAFPSVRKLAIIHTVSKKTIELAFKELINEDFCYAVHGKGMFLKRSPEDMGRACQTYGVVLGYQKIEEESLPFYRNLYLGAEKKITAQDDNILCLHGWAKKSHFRKKQELTQFVASLYGIVGIGLFSENDCLLLRDFGIPVVITDLDTISLGIDCVVFDNKTIMSKLIEEIISSRPEAIFYLDFKRTTNYDPAVRERRDVFKKKYKKYIGVSHHKTELTFSNPANYLNELAPLLEAIKKSQGKIALVCSCELTAMTACRLLIEMGVKPGEDVEIAYNGPQVPCLELSRVKSTIGVLDEYQLSNEAVELLNERINKGPGRAIMKKIPGDVIKWNPN